jgi:hypothetical protein
VPPPPYSPDLAPADFFLFPELNTTLKGRSFQTTDKINENAITELRHHRNRIPGSIPTMEEMLQMVYHR